MKLCVSRGTGRSAGRDARENPGIARAVLGVQKARVAEKLHCFLFRRHSAERVCVCVCFGFGCLCVAAAWLFSGGAWWRCRFRSFSHSASRLLSARWRGPLLEFRNTVVAAHKLFVVAVRCHHLLWKQRRQGYSATQARTLAIDSFFSLSPCFCGEGEFTYCSILPRHPPGDVLEGGARNCVARKYSLPVAS